MRSQALAGVLRAEPYELSALDAVHELFRLLLQSRGRAHGGARVAAATARVLELVPTLNAKDLEQIVAVVASSFSASRRS